ncbi:MAG: hypothetical protein ACI8XX_002306, partial [Polaribacter sp.]
SALYTQLCRVVDIAKSEFDCRSNGISKSEMPNGTSTSFQLDDSYIM